MTSTRRCHPTLRSIRAVIEMLPKRGWVLRAETGALRRLRAGRWHCPLGYFSDDNHFPYKVKGILSSVSKAIWMAADNLNEASPRVRIRLLDALKPKVEARAPILRRSL